MSIYAGEVRDALAGSMDTGKLAEAWQALHPKQVSKATPPPPSAAPAATGAAPPATLDGAAATAAGAMATGALAAFMSRARAAITSALRPVLVNAWTEGWVLGQQSARAVTAPPAQPPPRPPGRPSAPRPEPGPEAVLHDVDWGSWTPGDHAAAEQIAGPGLRQLLGEQNIRIKSIADSRLEELSKILEDTLRSDEIRRKPTGPLPPFLSVGDLASRLKSVLDNPANAELVAQAEIARAQAAASRQVYAETGRTEVEVSTAEDDHVCARCDAAAKLGPHPLGAEPLVPLHPRCRCAELPVLDFGEDQPEPEAAKPAEEPAAPAAPEERAEPEPEPEPAAAPELPPAPAPAPEPEPEPEEPAQPEPHIDEGPLAGFDARKFDSTKDAADYLKTTLPDLDADQKSVLSWYTGDGFHQLNKKLRDGGDGGPEAVTLKSTMTGTPDDLVVTRRVEADAFGLTDATLSQLPDVVAGKVITDQAFMSTSLGKTPYGGSLGGVIMHLAVPKGTKAVAASAVSRNPHETELLLDSGQRIAVSRVERNKSFGWDLYGTILPAGGAAKAAVPGGGTLAKAASTVAQRIADAKFTVVGDAPGWAVTAWGAS